MKNRTNGEGEIDTIFEKLKFLKEAVKISASEISEELEAIEEGADSSKAHAAIRAILSDLLHSIDNGFINSNSEYENLFSDFSRFFSTQMSLVLNSLKAIGY